MNYVPIAVFAGQQLYSSLIQYVAGRTGHDFRYGVAIRQELGWQSITPFDEILKLTINYYLKKYISKYDFI